MVDLKPIRMLAIANRGEAAMRCIRTAKALRAMEGADMQVVALYTDVDRDAPFVRHADVAYRLPITTTAVATYLDHARLVSALKRIGADAVWPGWGFSAESPEFVDCLNEAGIRFLGPTSDTMRRLGDKIASKELAEAVGVPVTAWSKGVVRDVEAAAKHGEAIGFPLVVKASAGGGGRGIRMVHEAEALAASFVSAASEAKTAFGDDRLFMESMVRGGRHIEVQIVADMHGHVRAVGCRDCSVQRRHQKVLEEAPPHGLSREILKDIQDAAERLAAEVGYYGVGTVEFLVKGEDFFFLEMNPRLQVEHGITEQVSGLDLVELQIRVARGESIAGVTVKEEGYCIEARVCAEDPDQGFLPAPGEIALFDPALGPRVRVDSGVSTGSVVPPDFDSLIAKVMAQGATREEARARLAAALRDFDLVIAGGATNKGYLLELLDAAPYRKGCVDTLWLDRWTAERADDRPHAAEALVFAAIVAYRKSWWRERRNFFQDTSNITPDQVPALSGRELDLEYAGEQYRVKVYSVGAMRYRVTLDGETVSARFGVVGPHTARMVICGRYMRATYDLTDTYLHVELEGCVHRFGRQTAGQVRAGAPSMVVGVQVDPGTRVVVGQPLGVLEAMKMEIAFNAPVAGMVTEVRVIKGQQVAAGEVLVVIDPATDITGTARPTRRLVLPEGKEPMSALFSADVDGCLGASDFTAANALEPEARKAAVVAVTDEIWRITLGFDVLPERFERSVEFLKAPLPGGLSPEFLRELAGVSELLIGFADIDSLFSRVRPVGDGGMLGASNNALMRAYVRRIRTEGAGVSEEFLSRLRVGLAHYDVHALSYSDDLERAVLRMFASQSDTQDRHQLIMAALHRLVELLDAGVSVAGNASLERALNRIAEMRGELPNALADSALEAGYRAFQAQEVEQAGERTTQRLEDWVELGDGDDSVDKGLALPDQVLSELSVAPRAQFHEVQAWLGVEDARRRAIALGAFLRRLYVPRQYKSYAEVAIAEGAPAFLLHFDKWSVLGGSANSENAATITRAACAYAEEYGVDAVELIVAGASEDSVGACLDCIQDVLPTKLPCTRFTIAFVGVRKSVVHFETFATERRKLVRLKLHGLHPEAADRIDLKRYSNFDLERLPAPDGYYCFHAQAKDETADARVFMLVDFRGRPANNSRQAAALIPHFERSFQTATRVMRMTLTERDPRRRLQWNRVVLHVAQPLMLDVATAQGLARRLLVNVRFLGIEKTIVRLNLLNADRPEAKARRIEAVFADLASSRLEMVWRRPRKRPLLSASHYERRVAAARRRGVVYPYEIIHMLTAGDERSERALAAGSGVEARPVLPVGRFEEFDLDPDSNEPAAISVAGRHPGQNSAAVVFGVITTKTAKVREGMGRVLILSDPTLAMGALSIPECERVVAAIDLAERLSLPVEWIPVSSGARIAMDSGTENMDATAKVVRRIVTFTQAGGAIHLIISGINVGAQSYWDALATMLMHTRGALIMTPEASMVLTGRAALAASGSVSAEDEVSIGGHERVMGPNGQAQYFAADLLGAYAVLYKHYEFTYVAPGENCPRLLKTKDPVARDVTPYPYEAAGSDNSFETVGEIFDESKNPGRKRPFAMRALMKAVIDQDGGHLERWGSQVGAETAIVWDAHLSGVPITMIGIESQNVPRLGYRPSDGPEDWNGGTLFPLASKKVARALSAASGNRAAVVLANLSGFDGSPESMRKLQLEYGAEIARAVVNFEGPLAFLVVSRYHGGAYVVFSRMLNDNMRAAAVEGSHASVIGGGPAATVVFPREVRARVATDSRVQALRAKVESKPSVELRSELERLRQEVLIEKRAEVGAEFDAVHSVQRAKEVGSLESIVDAKNIRPYLAGLIARK